MYKLTPRPLNLNFYRNTDKPVNYTSGYPFKQQHKKPSLLPCTQGSTLLTQTKEYLSLCLVGVCLLHFQPPFPQA